jgi:hypothetical protein
MQDLDRDRIRKDFAEAVNMTASELKAWLQTKESRSAGWKGKDGKGSGESIGHASGRRIVAILSKNMADLTDDDFAHMRKVVGYVRRHSAQEPANVATSRWRYSLMNWGNDPLKSSRG